MQRPRQTKDLSSGSPQASVLPTILIMQLSSYSSDLTHNVLVLSLHPSTHALSLAWLSDIRVTHTKQQPHSLFHKMQLDGSHAALPSEDSCLQNHKWKLFQLDQSPLRLFQITGFVTGCLAPPSSPLPPMDSVHVKIQDGFPEPWGLLGTGKSESERNKIWPSGESLFLTILSAFSPSMIKIPS